LSFLDLNNGIKNAAIIQARFLMPIVLLNIIICVAKLSVLGKMEGSLLLKTVTFQNINDTT